MESLIKLEQTDCDKSDEWSQYWGMDSKDFVERNSEDAAPFDNPIHFSLKREVSEPTAGCEYQESEYEDDCKTFVEQLIDDKGKMWDRKDRMIFVDDDTIANCNVKLESNGSEEESELIEKQLIHEEGNWEGGDDTLTENWWSSCAEKDMNKDTLSVDASGRPVRKTSACDSTTAGKTIHKDRSNPQWKCHLCNHTTMYKRSLKVHIDSVHLKVRNHKCQLCAYTAFQKHGLQRHINSIHLNLKNHNCRICNYATTDKHNLKSHIDSVHLKLKKYKCDLCDYAATLKHHLKYHIEAVHLKLRNHKCQLCNFAGTHKTFLKRHIDIVHLKLKDHKCHFCDYETSYKFLLKTHIDSEHLNVKKHKCHLCDYKTTRKARIKGHIDSVHLKLRPHKCHLCDYTTTLKKHLEFHMDAVHLK